MGSESGTVSVGTSACRKAIPGAALGPDPVSPAQESKAKQRKSALAALSRRPGGTGPGLRVAVHGLLQLGIHFVSDGHHVQQHLAKIHTGQVLL